MQLKLKNESIKHLASKKGGATPADAAAPSAERAAELEREVEDLRRENAELRKEHDAPLAQVPC
jgi:hypothetical protein